MNKVCSTCAHVKRDVYDEPCHECLSDVLIRHKYWKPKDAQYKELTEMTTDKQYADTVYAIVKYECSDLDSIYEDYIIKLVGEWGLQALRENGLLEGCGYLNGRKLYVLCDK